MTPAELCAKWRARGGWAEDAALGRCRFPIGPRNTWSNVAYPLAGAGAYLLQPGPEAAVHAAGMLALGLTSGWYHGSKRWIANLADRGGMYGVFLPLALYGIAAGHPAAWVLMLAGGLLGGVVFPAVLPLSVNTLMGACVLVALLPALLFGAPALALTGLGCFLLGKLCWVLDRRRVPLVGLWGHAIWHALTALGASLLLLARLP